MSNEELMIKILEYPNLTNFNTKHIWGTFVNLHESLVILYDESVETGIKLQQILDMYEEMDAKKVKKTSVKKVKVVPVESSIKMDF